MKVYKHKTTGSLLELIYTRADGALGVFYLLDENLKYVPCEFTKKWFGKNKEEKTVRICRMENVELTNMKPTQQNLF